MNAAQKAILNNTFRDFSVVSFKRMDIYYQGRARYISAYDLCRFLLEPYCNTDLCKEFDYQNYKTLGGAYSLAKFKTNARDRLMKTLSGAVNTLTKHYSGKKRASKNKLANAQSILGQHVRFAKDRDGSIALVVPFNKKSLTGFLKDINNKKEERISDVAKELQKLTNQKDILSAKVTQHVLAASLLENPVLGATPKERIDTIVEWLLQCFSRIIPTCRAQHDGYKQATIYRGAKGLQERAAEDAKLIANGQTRRQRNNHKARN